jgi:hypothetical protein
MTRKDLVKELKSVIKFFKKGGQGCTTIKLNDRLALCVGYLDGYDSEDIDLIHAAGEPTWCLNAGIKVWTSDSMRTDYGYINSPFYRSGDVWATDVSLGYSEDIEALARYFLKEYKAMKKCEIATGGEILNYDSPEDYCRKNEVE